MGKLVILNHPLIDHKMCRVRDKNTSIKTFREQVNEISMLMAYEITRDLKTTITDIETPMSNAICKRLGKDVVIVAILRAGLGMVEGIHRLIPSAKVGHIGLYRDEKTLETRQYYAKLPPALKAATILVLDPMLATGSSACRAIDILKEAGAKDIRFVGIVGCPEGVKALETRHVDVDIYLAALDEKLNADGYIVPGLGDCGDRLFGTK